MSEVFYKALAYINGKFIDSKEVINVFSVIDGTEIGSIATLNKQQVDLAFEGSYRTFNIWKNLAPNMRIKKIKEFMNYFIQDIDLLANLMVLEIGKNLEDARSEIQRTYDYMAKTIEIYENEFINPLVIDENDHNIVGKVGKFYDVPIGVVLAISSFNYPINLSLSKIIPSLITGNTVVFKPSTQGALVASQIAKYFDKAEFIPGVFNMVLGKGSEIGDAVIENKRIAGVSFTGSTSIGKSIASKLNMKHLVLELGGKDTAIVTKDADLELASNEIIKGAFNYSGQRCTAIKKVLVMEEVANDLISLLKQKAESLSIGDPFSNADIVPLIDNNALNYNISLIDDAINHGAIVVTGGSVVGHNLLQPTILDNVSSKCKISWEEQFGPVLPIIRVKSVNEAISVANSSEYGLQGSVFTKNKNEAKMIARYLETGTININKASSRGPDIFPFIGVKNSGFGVQGIRDSIKAMTRIKGIVENN